MRLKAARLAAVLLLAVVIAGCKTGEVSITGTWVMTSIVVDGVEYKGEKVPAVYGKISYTFEDGGKLICSTPAGETQGEWEKDGDLVTITVGDQQNTGRLIGGVFAIGNGNNNHMVFTKQQ